MNLNENDYLRHKEVGDYWQVEKVEGDLYTIVARATIPLDVVNKYYLKVEIPANG